MHFRRQDLSNDIRNAVIDLRCRKQRRVVARQPRKLSMQSVRVDRFGRGGERSHEPQSPRERSASRIICRQSVAGPRLSPDRELLVAALKRTDVS